MATIITRTPIEIITEAIKINDKLKSLLKEKDQKGSTTYLLKKIAELETKKQVFDWLIVSITD